MGDIEISYAWHGSSKRLIAKITMPILRENNTLKLKVRHNSSLLTRKESFMVRSPFITL